MIEVVGELLPLGLAVAISPFPVIATVLVLLSERARLKGLLFLIGWMLGAALVATVAALVVNALVPPEPSGANPAAGVVRILLGLALFFLASRKWAGRSSESSAQTPGWMTSMTTMSPTRTLTTGVLLTAVNPKNVVIATAAGVAVGAAELTTLEAVWSVAIFTVVASSTVAVAVIGYAFAADAMTPVLEGLRVWLTENNSTIMTVLLVVFGFVLLGDGIASFAA